MMNLLRSSRIRFFFAIIHVVIFFKIVQERNLKQMRLIMSKDKQNPLLYFNFVDHDGKMKPQQFINPVKIIKAQTVNEVIPCLKEVDKAINKGYYAAGYISYEAAPAFNQNLPKKDDHKIPLLWFGIFNEPIQNEIEFSGTFHTDNWNPTISIDDYYKNVDNIQSYIRDGRTKQVNYTIQLESNFTGEPIAFYKQLEQAQSANYSAFLDFGDYSILSASPELFFQLKDGVITTKPMKGTIGRGKTYIEDIKNAEWLKSSKKNQLENNLIVDLMRKELAEIAIPNTINVPHLYALEKYPTVYQMTSTITANIRPDINFIDIFKTLFPCGSITGIPKKETMDIISMLETDPREIYCGAIGWITPNKEAVFNVPIRTVLIDKQNQNASYGVGGAITKDSTKEGEYEEILIKARLLTKKQQDFNLLESLGLIDGEYLVYKEHLSRLTMSAKYFDFTLNIDEIEADLHRLALKHRVGQWKVRLLLAKSGSFTIEIEKIVPLPKEVTGLLSKEPIDKNHLFLYHKTTNRTIYNKHRKQLQDFFDVLLWNEDQEVTEFTLGNIVVEIEGRLYTPSLDAGLLAGTFRESLLQKGMIQERRIKVSDLQHCQKIWLINSVRGWVSVKIAR